MELYEKQNDEKEESGQLRRVRLPSGKSVFELLPGKEMEIAMHMTAS